MTHAVLRPVAALFAGVVLLLTGVGLLNTLVPLRAVEAGFSNVFLGGLTSAYYGGYLLGTFAILPLIARIGHIRAFAFCTACAACIVLFHALGIHAWVWLLLRLLVGIILVGLYTIIESWLNAHAPAAQRGRIFSIYMVLNLGALALGQQLLHLDAQPFVLFVLVAMLICAATVPVVTTRQSQPVSQHAPRLQLMRLYRTAPTAVIGALMSGLAMGAFWGLQPVYAHEIGFDDATVGTSMSIAILGGAALQWPLGRLSDYFDRRLALLACCVAALVLALAALLLGGRQWPTMGILFLYCGAAFAVYPIVVAHLVDHLPPEQILGASSTVLLLFGIGSATGPLIAGTMMSALGGWSLLAWYALTHGVLALYAGYRYHAFWRAQNDETHFVPMLRTTPAALAMMPETTVTATGDDTPESEIRPS